MVILYILTGILILLGIVVEIADWHMSRYRYKGGRRYVRKRIEVGGKDYYLWVPERRDK